MRYCVVVLSVCLLCFIQKTYAADDDYVTNNGSGIADVLDGEKGRATNKTSKSSEEVSNATAPDTRKIPDIKKSSDLATKSISSDTQFMPSTWKIVSIVGVIIFLASFALYLKFKKNGKLLTGRSQNQRQLKLLSDLSLTNGTLSLVSLGEKMYLIGSNEHSVTCLDQIVDPIERDKIINESASGDQQGGFHNEYNDMLHKMNQGFQESEEVAQKTETAETAELSGELDNLKQRLKELA